MFEAMMRILQQPRCSVSSDKKRSDQPASTDHASPPMQPDLAPPKEPPADLSLFSVDVGNYA